MSQDDEGQVMPSKHQVSCVRFTLLASGGHVRDVTFDEDRSQKRSGAAPQTCPTYRNLVIGLLRRSGATNIAAVLGTYASRSADAITLLLSAGHLR